MPEPKDTPSQTDAPSDEEAAAAPMEDDRPFSLTDYLIVVALFLGFLTIIHFAMIKIYPDTGGLTAFYVILGLGFILVAVYDYVFDRVCRTDREETADEA